ncbi:MAG: hypothetical protein AB7S81_01160 [Bdellovibrionales bacterium]
MRFIFLLFILSLSFSGPSYAYSRLAEEQYEYNQRMNLENDLFMQQQEMYELQKKAAEERESFERREREQQQEIEELKRIQSIKRMLH